jgi:hypothetical protein
VKNKYQSPRWFAFRFFLILSILSTSCSEQTNAPVNASKARETLKTALESWKRGEKSETLQQSTPPIYIIDAEWQSGVKLKDYQIVNEGKEMDAHWFCSVRLTIQRANGQQVTQEVTFVVSTAPNLTITRKIF